MPTLQKLAILGLLVLLTACTKVNSGVGGMFNFETDLKLILEVDEDINPDENHTPSPLYLRFYELKSDKAFAKADFLSLYENDDALLGDDLLAKRELRRVAPGETRTEKFVVDKETRYVALFAEFFQYKNSKYKTVFPVTSNNVIKNTVTIKITDNNLLVISAK